jgi:hypothetical protein
MFATPLFNPPVVNLNVNLPALPCEPVVPEVLLKVPMSEARDTLIPDSGLLFWS